MSSDDLEYCMIPEFYKDPELMQNLQKSIENSPEESLHVNNERFTYVENFNTLKDGDCIIANIYQSIIIFGRVIKDGDIYKIRYLDSLYNTEKKVETIEHPDKNNSELLFMRTPFIDFCEKYHKTKSMNAVKNFFETGQNKDKYTVINYQDGDNTISIKDNFFVNDTISITIKPDDEIIGIATRIDTNGTTTYKYYNLYNKKNNKNNNYVEKILKLTPYILANEIEKNHYYIKIYKNEEKNKKPEEKKEEPNTVFSPFSTVVVGFRGLKGLKNSVDSKDSDDSKTPGVGFRGVKDLRKLGPVKTQKNPLKGGRRRYKRKATKKNKKQKGKNTRRST